MKKALLVATVYGFIASFEQNNIRILQELGYEVWCACNMAESDQRLADLGVWTVDVPFERNPFGRKNMIAYKCLKGIIKKEKFSLIHCHTPVGGVLGRLAASSCGVDRIIYTAHGFHFYQGAPKANWLLYYPIEWWLAWKTDLLITINQEDYERAKKRFHAKKVEYVPGVGVNVRKNLEIFETVNKYNKRKELGILDGAIVMLSVGELNLNKNHEVVIEAMAELKDFNIWYVVCGKGILKNKLLQKARKLGVAERTLFLGYRNDIIEIMSCADLYLHPSKREGLPVSLMEAMSVGLPIVCAAIRGNQDLVKDGVNGLLVEKGCPYTDAIRYMLEHKQLCNQFRQESSRLIQPFSTPNVLRKMWEVYKLK